MSARNATNSGEVCRAAVFPSTSPVLVSNAAYRDSVPCRKYSKPCRSASRREWQHRILAVERLDRRLLIHTEHRRMRRRVQIKPNDIGGLLLKVRVVARHVAVQPLRIEAMFGPHPRHHHVTDLELCSQSARAPLSRPVWRRTLEGPFQNACLQRRSQRAGLLPRVPAEQPGQPLFPKSLAPAIDKRISAVQ